MTSAQKSEAKKLIAHSPLHAKELKKQCDLNGLTCKLNLVTTPLSERGTMVDFFVQQFNM